LVKFEWIPWCEPKWVDILAVKKKKEQKSKRKEKSKGEIAKENMIQIQHSVRIPFLYQISFLENVRAQNFHFGNVTHKIFSP
jgi:hypothetical protein